MARDSDRYSLGVAAHANAERARALIKLCAVLTTVAEQLDQDSLEDLGLLTRISELQDLVEEDLRRLADRRGP